MIFNRKTHHWLLVATLVLLALSFGVDLRSVNGPVRIASAQTPETETFVWALNQGGDNTKNNLIKITTEGQEVFRRLHVHNEGMGVDPRDGSAWVRSQDPYEEYWEITAKLDHCGYLLLRANVSSSVLAVDPNDGSVWIALPNGRELVKLDSGGQELFRVPLPVDGSPYALAIDPLDSSVWLATSGENHIVKLDASGNMLFSDTAPGFFSTGQQQIAVDSRDGSVWYTSRDVVIKRQPDGSNPLTLTGFDTLIGVAVDSRDGSAWITDLRLEGTGMVIKFDENGTELFRISVGASPHGIAVDGDDGSAWVGIEGALVKLSADDGTELLTVPTIGWPQNIVVANVPVLQCRPDSDGDLVPDEEDACPYDPDGWRDTDGDGVCNGSDNCPDVPNPGQENADGDVLGDACEWPNEPVFKNGYDLHDELRNDLGAIWDDNSSARIINNHGQVAGAFHTQDPHSHAFLWTPGQGAVDLGTLGGTWSIVADMNELGQVVGYSQLAPDWCHAFLWTPEQGMIDLGAHPGLSSDARCINNLGQVAGRVQIDLENWSPFFWSEETGMLELPVPLPLPELWWRCEARDINDLGHVVVNCHDWDQQATYVWSPDGGVMPLPTLGGNELWAVAINNDGHVVGGSSLPTGESRPFLWTEQGGMENLGSLGAGYGWAHDINDRGEVTGVSLSADWQMHPFLWTRDEGMIDLAAGFPETISDAYVTDISELGQIVGYVHIDGFLDHHAFLWTREGGLMDLGTLGGIMSMAESINDLGQAVGWAENDFNITPSEGQRHAVLWTIELPEESVSIARVGGYIFHDDNGDGALNLPCRGTDVTPATCEPGLGGATADTTWLSGMPLHCATNTSGWYSFNLLGPGTYHVYASPPAASWWTPTTAEMCYATVVNNWDRVFCHFGYWWGLDGPPVQAASVAPNEMTLSPTQDATISEWMPANHGADAYLRVRQPGVASALLQFDLTGLPHSAEIVWAKLRLYSPFASNGTNRLYMTAYPLDKAWVEEEVTWLQTANGSPWDEPGATGDHGDPVGWAWIDAPGWVEFDLDPAELLASDYGFLVRGEGTDNREVAYWLFSREYVNAAAQPQLLVGYNVP